MIELSHNDITSKDIEKVSGHNRREFLTQCVALGISTSFLSPFMESDILDLDVITIENVKSAEKIIGIELTGDERNQIIEGLNKNLKAFKELRALDIDDNIPPSMVFNPIPPGLELSKITEPISFSEVQVGMPDIIEDVAYYSILELADLIRTRRVTSVSLTKMYIKRLKRLNIKLECVITFTETQALTNAKRADVEIESGHYRGPLHGIPYGIKDLFSVKGYKTTWGATPFKDRIIDTNASVVDKLEEAGAVLIAKLSTGTLASGQKWFAGETRSPWDTDLPSGGSSAGPASATVAGGVGFSIGTETNGSMVSPCNTCGVTGLRPTFGRVSRYGVMSTSWSFDKVTPICRTVEDCAVVLSAIYGPDGKDNSIIDMPFNWNPLINIKDLRIGYHSRFFEKELMGNPSDEGTINYRTAIRNGCKEVLRFFSNRGFNLIPLDFQMPHSSEGDMLEIEASAFFDKFSRSKLDDEVTDQKWPNYFRRYHFWPAVEYLLAARYRSVIIQKMHEALKDVDVYMEITWSNNWTTNVTGYPIVVVPCGFINGVRPITITFVGKLFKEADLLSVAKAYQDATMHHLKRPNI